VTAEQKVARAAYKVASARQNLEDAIRAARAEGLALRPIAAAAGLSHEQVRKIASRQP
jgi:hypothetical protein